MGAPPYLVRIVRLFYNCSIMDAADGNIGKIHPVTQRIERPGPKPGIDLKGVDALVGRIDTHINIDRSGIIAFGNDITAYGKYIIIALKLNP